MAVIVLVTVVVVMVVVIVVCYDTAIAMTGVQGFGARNHTR